MEYKTITTEQALADGYTLCVNEWACNEDSPIEIKDLLEDNECSGVYIILNKEPQKLSVKLDHVYFEEMICERVSEIAYDIGGENYSEMLDAEIFKIMTDYGAQLQELISNINADLNKKHFYQYELTNLKFELKGDNEE